MYTLLNVTNFLRPNNENNVAVNKIKNQELLKRIEKIEQLEDDDQRVLTILLDAFIKKRKFEVLAQR